MESEPRAQGWGGPGFRLKPVASGTVLHRASRSFVMSGKRVLVVEDEAAIARLVALIVTQMGCEVDTASNGAEALLKIAQQKPDLVIVDLIMPVMTGEELIQELQGDPAHADIPIVLLSTRQSARGYKRDDFPIIAKPFQPETVREMVRGALGLT